MIDIFYMFLFTLGYMVAATVTYFFIEFIIKSTNKSKYNDSNKSL